MSTSEMTPKQERFCEEYLLDLNATQAAIRAGYSENGAQQEGSRLLSNVVVRDEIERLAIKRSGKLGIKAEDVLRETYLLAMSDLGEAFNDDGSLKPIREIPAHIRRAISSIEVDELFEGSGKEREHVGYTRKIKLWDKVKTLELLGRHLKIFAEHVEVTGEIKISQVVSAARERVLGGRSLPVVVEEKRPEA